MAAVVCPSCRCSLKAPSQLVGKKATCPKCRTEIFVTADKAALRPQPETKEHRIGLPAPDEDTFEGRAMDATAEQTPLQEPLPSFSGQTAPIEHQQRNRLLVRAAVFVLLASAATFALWMAIPQTPEIRAPHAVQPHR